MNLTAEQMAVFKAAILAEQNSIVVNALAEGNMIKIADWYNLPTNPAVNIWRPNMMVNEFTAAIVWTDYLTLTVEKSLAYQSIIWSHVVDMTDAQIRQGLLEIFGSGSTSSNNIAAKAQRPATNFEKLFATGGAVKTTPLFGSIVTYVDVTNALNS